MNKEQIQQAFFKDGNFVKQSVRAAKYDEFFKPLMKQFNTENKSEILWLLTNDRPVCRMCGSQTKFLNYGKGYRPLCSDACARKDPSTKAKRVDSIKGFLSNHYQVNNAMQHATVKDTIQTRYCRSTPRNFEDNRKERFNSIEQLCVEMSITHDTFSTQNTMYNSEYEFRHSCGHTWRQTLSTQPLCSICHKGSSVEKHFKEWIKTLDIDFISNDRSTINPLELDVFIPSKKVAFEINGLYWHHDGSGRTTVKEKTDLCQAAGVQLISIWENEWTDEIQRSKLQAVIKAKLGLSERIFARKTKLVDVDLSTARAFLNENHLQGWTSASRTIGLEYDNELVMVMSIGRRRWCADTTTELIRLCTKKGFTVVGGFSKMLGSLEKMTLVSYCDRRFGTGAGYEAVGFKLETVTKPNYVWWKNKTFLKRGSTTKQRLPALLGENYDENLSENENMISNGWRKLSDAGNSRYVLEIR